MQFSEPVDACPPFSAPDHIKWSILKPASEKALAETERQKLLCSNTPDEAMNGNSQKEARANDDSSQKKTHCNIAALAEALAPQTTIPNEESMKLKRTTVLSGNFAKKAAQVGGRSRAASENVQLF